MAQGETRVITIKMDASGFSGGKEVANQMKQINKSTKDAAGSMGTLKNAFLGMAAALGISFGIRQIVEFADNMQLLTDRIAAFTGSQKIANEMTAKLVDVANHTKASIADLGAVYNRFSVATQGLGISNEGILSTVQMLQQTFRLSGATQEEAAGSTIQLSQAFSLGALRGQELRSVMLGNATLAGILRREITALGGSTEEWGRKGLITPAFLLKALSKNFKDVEERASKLGQTFAQTVTVATNDLTVAVGKLNKEYKASQKFADGMEDLKNSLSEIFELFSKTGIPDFMALLVDIAGFLKETLVPNVNLVKAAFSGFIGPAGIGAYLEELKLSFKSWGESITWVFDTIISKAGRVLAFMGEVVGSRALEEFGISIRGEFAEGAIKAATNIGVLQTTYENLGKTAEKTKVALANSIPPNLKTPPKKYNPNEDITNTEKAIGALGIQFNRGDIGVIKYNSQLEKLTGHLLAVKQSLGKVSLNKINEDMQKLTRENIGRLFDRGVISITEYGAKLKEFKLQDLTQKFKEAKISVMEYHTELIKLTDTFLPNSAIYVGINQYIESSGNLSQNIAKNITLVFNTLENSLFDFIKTGTFEFAKFTQAILDDLTRIILRAAIVQPLANGIMTAFTPNYASLAGGSGDASSSNFVGPRQANGGAWDKGIQMFANGGVFSSPTMFQHSGGLGVLGEKGPEAVIPLTRGSDGKLGISGGGSNVTVNVINQSGNEVQQKETQGPGGEKVIDILITSKIKESMSNGSLDKTMSANYGIRRKGA